MNDLSNEWKVDTTSLFEEMIKSNDVYRDPLRILIGLLKQIAERAIELNDHELHKLMIRLSLYEIADPRSPNFDLDAVNKFLDS